MDTSIWVDHLRRGDPIVRQLLEKVQLLSHPMVVGELALGHLNPRDEILAFFDLIPAAVPARDAEVLQFISAHRLYGRGIGYVDAHLLASAHLTSGAALWTRDKRLSGIASVLNIAYSPA